MKFQPDRLEGVNAISARTADAISINGQVWRSSLIVPWRGDIQAWDCTRHADLQAAHFEALIALQPEVIIYGSGAALKFASPVLLRSLMQHRIGVESMDTAAACRTYNILVNEGRRVVAALLLG